MSLFSDFPPRRENPNQPSWFHETVGHDQVDSLASNSPTDDLPLVGFKVLRILGHHNPRLASQNNFGDIWDPGWNQAHCSPLSNETITHPPSETPARECMCGFHVWSGRVLAEDHQTQHDAFEFGPSVIAIIIGAGNLEIHPGEGWRSSHAKIVGFISEVPTPLLRKLAEVYGAQLVHTENANLFATQFGNLCSRAGDPTKENSWAHCQSVARRLARHVSSHTYPLLSRTTAHLDLLIYAATIQENGCLYDVISWSQEPDAGLATVTKILSMVQQVVESYPLGGTNLLLAPTFSASDTEELNAALKYATLLKNFWQEETFASIQEESFRVTRQSLDGLVPTDERPLPALEFHLSMQGDAF